MAVPPPLRQKQRAVRLRRPASLRCLAACDCPPWAHSLGPFFLIESGKRPTDCCARYNFAAVSQALGLRQAQKYHKHGRGPRIHDLRHTFAVRTIIGWYRKGLDPDREMIKLSTYLGHAKPELTYWYIEAVPELLQLASRRAERALAAASSEGDGR
jgi:integrase